MGPRKNNAAAAGKDDGTALGKMRKINPASASSKQHNTGLVVEIGYSAEERAFLESQLALYSSDKNSSGGSPVSVDLAAMSRERWVTGLPLLLSATEKLLHAAAEQYQIPCKNRGAAAAAFRTTGGTSPAPAPSGGAQQNHSSVSDSAKNGLNGNLSITDSVLPSGSPATPGPRPTPAAGTVAQFTEESAYIVSQAQQLQWYPFTYQRWLELLLDPGKYHTAKDEGRLRGDAIQASLRRCVLVTYPAVEGGDCI